MTKQYKADFLEGQDPHKTAIVPTIDILLKIKADVTGCRGWGQEWDQLNEDTQGDILQKWVKIIEPICREYGRQVASEAMGNFWAQKFPDTVLPTSQMVGAVDTVLPASAKNPN